MKTLKRVFFAWLALQVLGFIYGAQHELRCEDNTCTNYSHRLSHPHRF